jgi:hypothetical protein
LVNIQYIHRKFTGIVNIHKTDKGTNKKWDTKSSWGQKLQEATTVHRNGNKGERVELLTVRSFKVGSLS